MDPSEEIDALKARIKELEDRYEPEPCPFNEGQWLTNGFQVGRVIRDGTLSGPSTKSQDLPLVLVYWSGDVGSASTDKDPDWEMWDELDLQGYHYDYSFQAERAEVRRLEKELQELKGGGK